LSCPALPAVYLLSNSHPLRKGESHPSDVHRLNELLVKLRDKGNTVIVVEHDPDVIKLASELHKRGSIYVMDEPTTGLHLSDIGRLLTIMNRLVEGGNTVMLIEHHLDVIRNADWIIDMGPEGGMVIFEGTPRDLLNAKQSLTSRYL
jgi:excinuclease UvrABC ATPase subunit